MVQINKIIIMLVMHLIIGVGDARKDVMALDVVDVTYKTFDGEEEDVKMGRALSVQSVYTQPKVRLTTRGKEASHFLLLMFDPDAPYPFVKRPDASFRHWTISNIPWESLAQGEYGIENGTVASSYFAPRPPKGTGYHRYFFYIYKQEVKDIDVDLPIEHDSRRDFDHLEFAKSFNLTLVAHNFFTCIYSPSLYFLLYQFLLPNFF